MSFKINSKFWLIFSAIVIVTAASWYYFSKSNKQGPTVTSVVKFGDFSINVTTSGELEAKDSENILGPS